MKQDSKRRLSTADLVLLSLLAEKPMYGYQANAELERRNVRDWAGISRPQIYYSLRKLARTGLLRRVSSKKRAQGPQRQVFAASRAGGQVLADALERQDWCTQREKPAFLTWMALSWKARQGVFDRQLERRQRFLRQKLAKDRETLQAIREEVGHRFHEAVWMVTLTIGELQCELEWLARVKREKRRRAPARHPQTGKTI